MTTIRKFRPDIEGLRAVSVILVILAHAGLFLHGGFIGVDVFFVISGFLITRQLVGERTNQGRISLAGFYARRARRILPAATLVIITTLLLAWKFLPALRLRDIATDAIFAAISGVNYHLAQQKVDYF